MPQGEGKEALDAAKKAEERENKNAIKQMKKDAKRKTESVQEPEKTADEVIGKDKSERKACEPKQPKPIVELESNSLAQKPKPSKKDLEKMKEAEEDMPLAEKEAE